LDRASIISAVSQDILTLPSPPPDARIAYGNSELQFGDLRLPKKKGPHPVVMNIHGGFWRNKYDLAHAGHLCAALTVKGFASWNLEYRRVGDEGGAWPGTFRDVVNGYRFIAQIAEQYELDKNRVAVTGHSAGGQLALCLAAHERSLTRVISLAGVVDLQRGWELHLSNDAVADFLGGSPEQVPEHYQEAEPMKLGMGTTEQWLVHGLLDDVVPADFSHGYYEQKRKRGENVHLIEIEKAGHFEMIDPRSAAWPKIEQILVDGLRC
jgi:acetyl esterase/lipase